MAIFIDGGYLEKIMFEDFGKAKISFEKLVGWMSQGSEILRTYYYHCLPYHQNSCATEDSTFSGKAGFFNYLKKLPRFEVRLGKLEYRGEKDGGGPIYVQKKVDLLLGLDLAILAVKNKITHAAILAGDSDFLPAVEVAKNEGVSVCLFHSCKQRAHVDLWTAADERIDITQEVMDIFTMRTDTDIEINSGNQQQCQMKFKKGPVEMDLKLQVDVNVVEK